LCVLDGVAAFDFDEGRGGLGIAFAASEGDVLSTHVESELLDFPEHGVGTGVVPRALLWCNVGSADTC
jgi:hypothetical protein